ncbi:bifunctional helix-turn-helix transcriptional regulator/GNAT family N-acetyltransferase [Phenylobacterium sp. 58.2.17]|uniref:bifunctional helix-turn-helix transcriptional regulator/GNAT family N-acetyltransferase n=1 Tax=Phenylobacterium sp. 58.2.17 TaxID=2969306 RepID=UPI0022652805|nr:bifunctional helix-turn-helix transcriptional regulator/GNAT family N-acetyltransferase [Phenylobacterium sp. 58.2.17]MCX7587760.1 bifunctional helix-turn-helix transcriptional regulator/GNAT family N-acetyltransferase [Phenylobacterium sp. 58.2.17]
MTADTLSDLGVMFLGSRLKRLGDRLQTEAAAILQAMDLPVQPAQQPLLAVLRREGPRTVGAVAQHLRISQPTATRALQALIEQGLVEVSKDVRDQRQKLLSLTPAGEALMDRLEHDLWPRVEAAAIALCDGRDQELMNTIAAVEAALDARSLTERTLAPDMAVRDFTDNLAEAFYAINAEWIEEMFALEANDIDLMSNPRERIVDKGGEILFAEVDGLGVVGTCAIMQAKDGWFELTKMGVSKSARGRKVGEFLLAKAIERARAMGAADRLYLLTNTKCAPAIHLYEKLGFEHDAEVMTLFGARYERCDVAMRFRG